MGTHRKTYVFAHRGGWKFKKVIPQDLRPIFGGKTAWTRYLGAVSRTEAELEGRARGVEYDRLIRQLRKLDHTEFADIVDKGGWSNYQAFPAGTDLGLRFVEAVGRRPVDPGDGDSALMVVDAQSTAKRMRAEGARARKTLAKFDASKSNDLESLLLVWQQQVGRPPIDSTVATMRRQLRRFVHIVGEMPPGDVTTDHILAFKRALERRNDMGFASVEKHLQGLHILFNAAKRARIIENNPAAGVKATKPLGKFADEERVLPFTTAQVRTIFEAMKDESPDFQWVVRLLAYHGARSGEMCQLRIDDVTELYGVPVLRIHDRYGPLKNRFSRRDVPVHPACMGIVEYAKASRGPWLFGSFPDWRGRAGKFQRRGGPFLREIAKISDPKLTMHSFRHLWTDLARNVEMPDVYAYAIQGHSLGKGHHGRYGTGPSPQKLQEWISKIDPLA